MGDDRLPIGERGDGIVRSEPIVRNVRGDGGVNPLRAQLNRRREHVAVAIERNRQGDYHVPTWVLALVLAAMVAVIVAFIVLG